MSFVRPGDEGSSGDGYVTTNTPGQTLGQLLGLSSGQAEEAKNTAKGKVQEGVNAAGNATGSVRQSAAAGAQETKAQYGKTTHSHQEQTTVSNSRSKESSGQVVVQQSGADKFGQAADETMAARDAAAKINISKAELEEYSKKATELHELAIEEANHAMAAAEQLQSLEDRAAAKDAAVKKLLNDLQRAKEQAHKGHTVVQEAKGDADTALKASNQAAREAEKYPALLDDKKRRADQLRDQINNLTSQLHNLQTEIKKDETEGMNLRQKADATREQAQAKTSAKENANQNLQNTRAQVEKIEQELGQQQKDKDAAAREAQNLESKAQKQSDSSRKVEAKMLKAEEELKAKAVAVKAEESAAQDHWERAKKLGNSAEAETAAAEKDAIKKAEKTISSVETSTKTEAATAKIEEAKSRSVGA